MRRTIIKFIRHNKFSMSKKAHSTMYLEKSATTIKLSQTSNDEYKQAIKDLNDLQCNSVTLSLAKYDNPKDILPLFANQLSCAGLDVEDLNKLNIIHVAGTKGKGSTCAFVESILRHAGEKTGFYNSPHLIKVNERIRINGQPIDDATFSKHFRYIYDKLKRNTQLNHLPMPGYFSFLTILAFHVFLEEEVNCAVIEVGIGGEYDPTNIVEKPIACAISTLDYDHTNILGSSIEMIASAKAGIIKPNVPVFTINQEYVSALNIIKDRAKALNSPIHICEPIDKMNIKLGIQGSAQSLNASLGCQLAREHLNSKRKLNLKSEDLRELPESFKRGLESCSWAGRCQAIRYPKFSFFLDGAHTKMSMENCLDWYLNSSENNDPESHKVLMMNIIGEREKKLVMEPLAKFNAFDEIIFSTNKTKFTNFGHGPSIYNSNYSKLNKSMENAQINAQTWVDLLRESGKDVTNNDNIKVMSSIEDSIMYLIEKSRRKRIRNHVLATGSLHFVGAMLETLQQMEEELLKL